MKKVQAFLFLLVILAVPIQKAAAQSRVFQPAKNQVANLILSDEQESYDLDCMVDVLAVDGAELSFEEISSPQYADAFTPYEETETAGQLGLWLRLKLANEASPKTAWLLVYDSSRINQIFAYLPEGTSQGYREIRTGNTYPFSTRDFEYQHYVFNLDIPPGEEQTLYLYLSDLSGIIPLSDLRIESLSHFSEDAFTQYFWSGAYYFFVITILIYNIFFIFSLRNPAVISYVLFLLSVIFTSIANDGYGHQFVWPNLTWLSESATIISISLFLVAMQNFTIVLLDLASYYPRWARFSKGFIIGALALTFLRYFPGVDPSVFTPIIIVIILIGFSMPVLVAIRLIGKQRRLSILFLIAISAYLAIMIAGVFDNILGNGVLEDTTLNRVGFSWVLVIFTFISNHQIVTIRKEKESAQKQLLAEKVEALRIQTELTTVLEQSRDTILDAYDTTLEGWAHLLEMRDKETEGHSRRVIELTELLAKEVGCPQEDLIHIRRGALLHDIGKIAIPDEILQKPRPLSDEEWVVMKRHTLFAKEALEGIPYLEKALDIPLYHHERWDGSGYPYQLSGLEIPLAARIFAVIDNWEALLSDRPYREAWSYPRVMDYLRQHTGSHFDPEIVPIFIRLVDDLDYHL